jgi:hypothetical protein
MRKAIHELSHVVEGHFYVEDKKDITVILNARDTLELIQLTDVARYDEASIRLLGEYFLVSSSVIGSETGLFVQSIHAEDGTLLEDDTDILIVAEYLPQEIKKHAIEKCSFEELMVITDTTTYEDIIKRIEG